MQHLLCLLTNFRSPGAVALAMSFFTTRPTFNLRFRDVTFIFLDRVFRARPTSARTEILLSFSFSAIAFSVNAIAAAPTLAVTSAKTFATAAFARFAFVETPLMRAFIPLKILFIFLVLDVGVSNSDISGIRISFF